MDTLLPIYEKEIPPFLRRAAETAPIQRLRGVGMNCGCEYTSFPRFADLKPYSRFDHSLGVALITWHFTHDKTQAMAGLLHDVATPCFAHVVDFLRGDYLTQEATEAGARERIEQAADLQALLWEYGLFTDTVADCHRCPIVDNESPRLCADRLEYTMGNLLNYSLRSLTDIVTYYCDLTYTKNESGSDELAFRRTEVAESFALGALACSRIYVSAADRCAMQALAELLGFSLARGYIGEQDLYGTEAALIRKLPQREWSAFRSLARIELSRIDRGGSWRRIAAKKRCIDPLVVGKGRLSFLSDAFSRELQSFREQSQDDYMRAIPLQKEEQL